MESVLTQAAEFGPYAFILVLILLIGFALLKLILPVIERNSTAMEKLSQTTAATIERITAHDERSIIGWQQVSKIDSAMERVEEKLEALTKKRAGQ